jgi:predicted transcriptional regulator
MGSNGGIFKIKELTRHLSQNRDGDIAADVLEEVIKGPNLAPGRIFARAGTNYEFRRIILDNGLVECEKTGKRNTRMRITEKGRTFLQHYRLCKDLLPP